MRTLAGKIEQGKVVVENADQLPEGAQVTVVVHDQDVFDLDDESVAELDNRRDRARAGGTRHYSDLDALKADLWSPWT